MLGTRVLAVNEVGDNGGSGDGLGDESKRVKPKIGRSKSQKTSKSQKLFKSGKSKSEKSKKPSKSGNLPNFNAKDSGPSFLIPKVRSAFNCLRLAFTEVPIIWHFDMECHIQIETHALGYAINNVLN